MSISICGIGPVTKIKTELAKVHRRLATAKEELNRKKETIQKKVEDLKRKNEELDRLWQEFDGMRQAINQSAGASFDTADPGAFFAHLDPRKLLSMRYLRGEGIEVGALHNPTITAPGAKTRYYDYQTRAESIARFPHLEADKIVEVDYVGDGEKLDLIADGSLDYLIANHMLEHCQDVIATVGVFWRKLRQNGVLFLSLPDKRYTFDYRREITPFDHLAEDHARGPAGSLYDHYVDFQRNANLPTGEIASEEAVRAMPHVDVHFHVWTQFEILEMLVRLRREHGFQWEVEAVMRSGIEVIMVLRKEEVQSWDRNDPSTKPA